MQNSNTKLAAQLVTRQLHPEKGSAIPTQPVIQTGQTGYPPVEQVQGTHGSEYPQVNDGHPGNTSGNIPVDSNDPEQTSTPGQQEVQTQYQGNHAPTHPQESQCTMKGIDGQPVTGQPGQPYPQQSEQWQATPYPQGGLQGQPNSQLDENPLDQAPTASPTDDFGDVYRTGNFGTHFGKVNVPNAKRWLLAHGILSMFMAIFTLAASIMLDNYVVSVISDLLLAFTWLAVIVDWAFAASAVFFIWNLSTLEHPLRTLMIMRTCATLSFVFNMFFFLVGILGILIKYASILRAAFVIISILMAVKLVTSYAFVFLWWKNRECCECFSGRCVFDEGEELAPGVANSSSVGTIITVGQVAQAVGNEMDRI